MKNKLGWLLLFSLIVIICPATASDAAWRRPAGKGERDPGAMIAKRLNLTAEQKKLLVEDSNERRAKIKPVMEKIKGLELKLRAELSKDPPDRTAVHNYIKEINDQRIALELKRIDSLLD